MLEPDLAAADVGDRAHPIPFELPPVPVLISGQATTQSRQHRPDQPRRNRHRNHSPRPVLYPSATRRISRLRDQHEAAGAAWRRRKVGPHRPARGRAAPPSQGIPPGVAKEERRSVPWEKCHRGATVSACQVQVRAPASTTGPLAWHGAAACSSGEPSAATLSSAWPPRQARPSGTRPVPASSRRPGGQGLREGNRGYHGRCVHRG